MFEVERRERYLVEDEPVAGGHDNAREDDADEDKKHLGAFIVLRHDGACERCSLVAHLSDTFKRQWLYFAYCDL